MVKRRFLCSLLCCPLLCGFGARVSECDVRHARSQDSLARSSEYQFRSVDFFENHQSSLSINGVIFSKTHQSSLTLKEGSTSFPKPLSPQGTGDVPTALLGAQTASL